MSNNNSYCCVPGCKSWSKRNPALSFHRFPTTGKEKVYLENKFNNKEQIDRQKAWILKLKIGKPITKYMKVCSLHFKQQDFFARNAMTSARKFLKKNAVPSENLPLSSKLSRTPRSSRNRNAEANQNLSDNETCSHEGEPLMEKTSEDIEAAETLLSLLKTQPHYVGPKTFRDLSIQVNTPKIQTICDLITTDSVLSSFTGLNSFQMLDVIVEAVNLIYKDERAHKLNIKERIILTFVKLKCNLTYCILGVLFNIPSNLCKTYIQYLLPILALALKPAIEWPSSHECRQNLPHCFQDFPNVRVVLDCTEIYIQKPKCLCCRIRFYSHYKSSQTVKFMTAVSPGGLITFVSEPYGGRASDKMIFEQSNLISKLERQRDAIMVDKGFLIDDICTKHDIKLIRPPFLKKRKQLSAEEAAYNAKIAAARVHIERVNQRIKVFNILGGKLQWHLVRYVKDIILIASAITNLSAPILADCRFINDM